MPPYPSRLDLYIFMTWSAFATCQASRGFEFCPCTSSAARTLHVVRQAHSQAVGPTPACLPARVPSVRKAQDCQLLGCNACAHTHTGLELNERPEGQSLRLPPPGIPSASSLPCTRAAGSCSRMPSDRQWPPLWSESQRGAYVLGMHAGAKSAACCHAQRVGGRAGGPGHKLARGLVMQRLIGDQQSIKLLID